MATLTALQRSIISLGGEPVRVDLERMIGDLTIKYDAVFNVPENAATIVTLYDSSLAGAIAAWSYGVIIVDPANLKPTQALPLIITENTSTGASPFFSQQVTREVPLTVQNRQRGVSTTEPLAAAALSATGLLRLLARNPAVANSGGNNVQCRILLVG